MTPESARSLAPGDVVEDSEGEGVPHPRGIVIEVMHGGVDIAWWWYGVIPERHELRPFDRMGGVELWEPPAELQFSAN